jgi:4-amino-4-deoxy-L-arabinose transferase-like glycosyltransferase
MPSTREPDSPLPTPGSRGLDVPLLAILALALLFRLYRIDVPLVDGHSWRQVTNADIARHFAQSTWNLFNPQVSWGGQQGVVGMEFPLLHYLIGIWWRVFGETEQSARLITLAFSTTSVALIYATGRELFSVAAGRGAAFLLAFAPSSVYFGRAVLSDTPMVTFSIAAILTWHRALSVPTWRRVLIAAACTALAGLVKLPGVIIGLPIVALAFVHRGRGLFRDRQLWAGGIASVGLIGAWYWYADRIAERTGLTQAIFRPSGRYGPELGIPESAYATVSHWTSATRLQDPQFYSAMLDRFWSLHLTSFGFAGALIGWWLARGERYALVLDAWLAAGVLLLLGSAEGQFFHEFHQLPLIPPLALFFGIALAPLFNLERLRAWSFRAFAVSACLVAAAVMAFRFSGVMQQLYRDRTLQTQFVVIGEELRSITRPDDLFVTVDYDTGGTNSPMSLYFAHRQGWSFDIHAIEAPLLERLRERFGARYFVTFRWRELAQQKPAVAEYLQRFGRVQLETGNSQVRMFDLRQPTVASGP